MGDRTTRVDQQGNALPVDGLTDVDVDLYGRIAAGNRPGPQDVDALARLREWGMVGEDDGRPVVMPPTVAAWTVAEQGLAHLVQQIQALAGLPKPVEEMSVQFDRSRFRAGGASEFLAERAEVNERMEKILAGAQFELLGAHPHKPRTREQMKLGIPRDTAAIDRGVRYRTLYQDVVRDDAVSCEWATVMSDRGAQYRTLADPFERVIIVDRKIAVISNYVIPDAPDGAAWIITDRAMVGFAVHAFEQEWRRASVWHGERRVRGVDAGEQGLSDYQVAILDLLADGKTQAGVAQRYGKSERSVQRELDKVRARWGMPEASLLQVMFHWGAHRRSREGGGLEQAA